MFKEGITLSSGKVAIQQIKFMLYNALNYFYPQDSDLSTG